MRAQDNRLTRPSHSIPPRRHHIKTKPHQKIRYPVSRPSGSHSYAMHQPAVQATPVRKSSKSSISGDNSHQLFSVKSSVDRTSKRFPQQKTPKERRIAPRHLPWCHPPLLGTSISQFAAGGANHLRYLGTSPGVRSDGAIHRSGTRNQSQHGHTQLATPQTKSEQTRGGAALPLLSRCNTSAQTNQLKKKLGRKMSCDCGAIVRH